MSKKLPRSLSTTGLVAQQGASLFMAILFLLMLLFIVTFAVTALPPYFTNMKIQSALDDVPEGVKTLMASDGGEADFKSIIKRVVFNNLRINGVRDIPTDNISFKKIDDNVQITIHYETRENLYKNLFIVSVFDDSVLVPLP